MDTQITNAGILLNEIESRLDGQGKALLITAGELLFIDQAGLQRAPLRQVTKVAIDKTGSLSIRSASTDLITGNIRGFDLTALKFFLENAKSSIAKAKLASKEPTITQAAPPEPIALEAPAIRPIAQPATQAPKLPNMGTLEEDNWGTDPALSKPKFDTWNTKASETENKSLIEPRDTFEIAPDDDLKPEPHPGHLGKSGGVEWANDPQVQTHLNNSQVLPTQIGVPKQLVSNASDVGSEVSEWNEAFQVSPSNNQTRASVAANSDWSGEILEAASSLDAKTPTLPGINASSPMNMTKHPTPTIDQPIRISNMPNLAPFARWLRILSVFVGALGVAGAALLLPKDLGLISENPLQAVAAFSSFFVGLILALIAYGMAELFTAWSGLASDVRSLKRATMGH